MLDNNKSLKRDGSDRRKMLTGAALEAAKRQARAELQRILDEEVRRERGEQTLSQTAAASRSY
jgi:hypothetical protein